MFPRQPQRPKNRAGRGISVTGSALRRAQSQQLAATQQQTLNNLAAAGALPPEMQFPNGIMAPSQGNGFGAVGGSLFASPYDNPAVQMGPSYPGDIMVPSQGNGFGAAGGSLFASPYDNPAMQMGPSYPSIIMAPPQSSGFEGAGGSPYASQYDNLAMQMGGISLDNTSAWPQGGQLGAGATSTTQTTRRTTNRRERGLAARRSLPSQNSAYEDYLAASQGATGRSRSHSRGPAIDWINRDAVPNRDILSSGAQFPDASNQGFTSYPPPDSVVEPSRPMTPYRRPATPYRPATPWGVDAPEEPSLQSVSQDTQTTPPPGYWPAPDNSLSGPVLNVSEGVLHPILTQSLLFPEGFGDTASPRAPKSLASSSAYTGVSISTGFSLGGMDTNGNTRVSAAALRTMMVNQVSNMSSKHAGRYTTTPYADHEKIVPQITGSKLHMPFMVGSQGQPEEYDDGQGPPGSLRWIYPSGDPAYGVPAKHNTAAGTTAKGHGKMERLRDIPGTHKVKKKKESKEKKEVEEA